MVDHLTRPPNSPNQREIKIKVMYKLPCTRKSLNLQTACWLVSHQCCCYLARKIRAVFEISFLCAGRQGWKIQFRRRMLQTPSDVLELSQLGHNTQVACGPTMFCRTFLRESHSQCPIWCNIQKVVNLCWWKPVAELMSCSQMDFWSTSSQGLILGNIFPIAGLVGVLSKLQLWCHLTPFQL